jgi:hypothetical protein
MQSETAKMLVESIANNLGIAIDNRNKIRAFEIVLEKHSPALFQEYLETLEEVREHPPTSISLGGFSNLQSKLVQE